MANCTEDDVRRIISTTLSDEDVTAEIVQADAEITARLLDSRPADVKKTISMLLTAELIALKEPRTIAMGGASMQAPSSAGDYREHAEKQIAKTGKIPFKVINS